MLIAALRVGTFEEFIGVKVENMVIYYCGAGPRNAAVELVNGSCRGDD